MLTQMKKYFLLLLVGLFSASMSFGAAAEKPWSSLWLAYEPLPESQQQDYAAVVKSVYCPGDAPVVQNAQKELQTAVEGLLGRKTAASLAADGTIVLGTVDDLKGMIPKNVAQKAKDLKDEGFVIVSAAIKGKQCTVIISKSDTGVLYGVFHFIRLMQSRQPIDALNIAEEPTVDLRMLNHWDRIDGHIERGYAGRSLWKWDELPGTVDPRYEDYARFCASVGINATAINNVNADSEILTDEYLQKVNVLADVFRAWGVKLYLSANFAAPIKPSLGQGRKQGCGNLETADPLDPAVQAWWTAKVAEIYTLIPDFGGFVVKANSEGMAGPRTYDRSHVEGANMFADILKPHGGIVLWRAFVYGKGTDRAKDAYNEFQGFDGQFRDNAFLQVKNGPIDFQPREPFSPLFGAMPQTDLALELQITKEYMGHSTTMAFLAPSWSEVLLSDTYVKGEGSTVAKVIDGSLFNRPKNCIAGVANTGDRPDWCGNIFNQANWYAFGRLAWNHQLNPEQIASEWVAMTFNCDAATAATIQQMMLGSYEATVDYTMPLGLMHMFQRGSHYGPGPGSWKRYLKPTEKGLGVNRSKTGSNYAGQYHPKLQEVFNDMDTIPLEYIMWFHQVPWHYKLSSGRTLWEELSFRYDRGVAYVDRMAETWKTLEGKVDPEAHKAIMAKLQKEQDYARLWRKTCLEYFAQFNDQCDYPIKAQSNSATDKK